MNVDMSSWSIFNVVIYTFNSHSIFGEIYEFFHDNFGVNLIYFLLIYHYIWDA
jgi:hypothetical protein